MDQAALRSLLKRLEVLERTAVRARLGEVTDDSPLTITLGGADTEIASAPALADAPLATGDPVAVLTHGNGLLVLGRIGDPPAWTAFDPTITTLGSGGTKTAAYVKHGRLVHYRGRLDIGAGGLSGSDVTISLPFASASGLEAIGTALGVDTGVYRHFGYAYIAASASVLNIRLLPNGTDNSPVNLAATAPFTWGAGDILHWNITYEAAS